MKLRKEKDFVPTLLLVFGPPRVVFSMDEWEEEVDRQKLLAAVGLLRRWDGRTWGWSMAVRAKEDGREGKQVWHWSSSGNFMESKHVGVEDFERAWAEVTGKRRAS
jgi:hypothetical protein